MDFEVRPLEGVGELDFEMSRDAVRKILGEPDKTEKQNPEAKTEMDVYGKRGITTHFGDDDKLDMVEFSGPDAPTYDGDNLLKLENPGEWIEEYDEEADVDPPDITSNELGISFYVPESGTRSVGIFKQGYYD